ncbi:MAG: hypothetical protein IKB51_04000 [Clostridia bacterium]|nr:hypothetical protein [Clostridia bacterium]
MMDIKTVKMDLRRIKYGRKNIESLIETVKKDKQHLKFLELRESTRETLTRIENLKGHIEVRERDIERKINEITVIEKKYESAIASLNELDQIIVREGYIGGKVYSELGGRIGYTERGIENRMKHIIEELAGIIE